MPVDERARHILWNRLEEFLGEDHAATLIELLQPAYEALLAREPSGGSAVDVLRPLTVSEDVARHRLWRRLDQVLGSDCAWTLIQLWDEAGPHTGGGAVRAA